MTRKNGLVIALFYCQRIPGAGEKERQSLEATYGGRLRLYPLPCSGRFEALFMLRALEEFADAAYLVTCPEGECRYFTGNRRAVKRVETAKDAIMEVGLEPERVGVIQADREDRKPLARLAGEIMGKAENLAASPVLHR